MSGGSEALEGAGACDGPGTGVGGRREALRGDRSKRCRSGWETRRLRRPRTAPQATSGSCGTAGAFGADGHVHRCIGWKGHVPFGLGEDLRVRGVHGCSCGVVW